MNASILFALIALMFTTAVLAIGYLIGSYRTRGEIAASIRAGELSLEQRADQVAMQIEIGIYRSAKEVDFLRRGGTP